MPEPPGGAHTDHERAAQLIDSALQESLEEIRCLPVPELLERRYQKFRRMGQFFQEATEP